MDASGWIDLQVNGFLGIDFSTPALTLDGVRRVTETLRARGTSAYCPTLVTCAPEVVDRNVSLLAQAMREPELEAHLLGIHLEGPFLALASRGAHPVKWLAAPDCRRFDDWQRQARGGIRILTLAPELEGAPELIRHVVTQGVVVSLGHHMADADAVSRAVDAGATLCTHLGNGIANTLPRHPNPIWTQLANDALTACVIADGHHVPPSFLRVAWRTKGRDRLIVTSDAAAIAGLPAGDYDYMGASVTIERNGRIAVRNTEPFPAAGTTLAGSSSTMADCLRHLAALGDWSTEDLLAVGRYNPLRVLHRQT